jgi:excisionase family DNA binding protein
MTATTLQPRLLTINEACAYASVSRSTIYEWAKAGKIRLAKFGNALTRVDRQSLEAFIDAACCQPS